MQYIKYINIEKFSLALSTYKKNILYAILSAILLILAYPDNDLYLLEWIAFIPLLKAIENLNYKQIYWIVLITGIITICGGSPWIIYVTKEFTNLPAPINYICWLLNGFYNAQLFCLIFIMHIFFKKHTKIPDLLLLPVIFISIWSVFPTIFYFTLANGNSNFLTALQATEFTGDQGLDFIIIIVNVFINNLMNYHINKVNLIHTLIAILIIIVWFSYGQYSLKKWDNEIIKWDKKKIGFIQPNRPSSLKRLPIEKNESIFNPFEFKLSQELVLKGAKIILWPEGHYRAFIDNINVMKSYNKKINALNVPLIFHDLPTMGNIEKPIYRNSTIWIKENGKLGGIYHKRKLVPFGEYLPVINKITFMSKMMGLRNMTPGKKSKVFHTAGMKIQPVICYEMQFSRFIAESIGKNGKGKVIVAQSNDGWYGNSSVSEHHRSSNALRAVENRIPLIHIINNGKSSIVMPNGRILYLSESWKRISMNVNMPYNSESGGSFFSKNPNLFIYLIKCIFIIFFIILLVKKIHFKK